MDDTPLPTEHDFDPWKGNLDAQCAWKNFGGLTLDEAQARFRENPECYQEDFMFMGAKAFAFYYPVIEDYLRSVPDAENFDDHQAWILAHGLLSQFETDVEPVKHLAVPVKSLADYVVKNIDRFGADDNERQRVADAWTELAGYLSRISAPTA